MRIQVLKKDIRGAMRSSIVNCPVARAVCREVNDKINTPQGLEEFNPTIDLSIMVDGDTVRVNEKEYRLSRKMRKNIVAYDNGKAMKPTSFVLKGL